MRLGDLDALKEDLKQYFSDGVLDSVSAKIAFNMILRKIDNAPTVDLWQMRQEATENALKKAEVLYDRPQGEWIEKHCDYGVYYRCSNCHKMPPNYECDYKEGAIKTNFCPNCGADMRKGGAE